MGKALGFTKEAVIGWITEGFGDSKCPHDRGPKYNGKEFKCNLDEVKAWRESVGMDTEKGGDKPLIAEAEKAAEAKAEDAQQSAALKAELMDLLVKGDMFAGLRVTLVRINELVETCKRKEKLGSQTLQQLSAATGNISREARQLMALEAERDRMRAGVMDRSTGNRILAALGEQLRQSQAALGATIAAEVRKDVADKGVGVEQEEAFQRVAAAAAQKVLDAELERVADGIDRAADQLSAQGNVGDTAPAGGVGLFEAAA